MPRFTCPQGHLWEVSDPSSPRTLVGICPVCGVGGESAEEEDRSSAATMSLDDLPPAPRPTLPRPAAPDAAGPQPWPTLAGYEILEKLGQGGMGVVYKARQKSLKRIVALKMLSSGGLHRAEERARFRIEAETVARIRHPNIVQIHEVGEEHGQPFLALEYVDGGSLAEKLAGTPLPPLPAARLVATVARAIHAAHRHGVVHRDLKPANILLASSGVESGEGGTTHHSPLTTQQPKITDFGLAKNLDAAGPTPSSGAVLGTPSYMAPEQASGKTSAITPAVDIYACGALLYDILTGRPPFKADTPLDTVLQVIWDEPVPPSRLQPKVPRDLETIVLKCLHKEPRRRYASALALAEDLERFAEGQPILARPVGAWERAWKWAHRHPAPAALATLCALLVLGLLAAGIWYAQNERQQALDAQHQRDQANILRGAAEKAEKETRQLLADSYAFTAQLAMRRGDWRTALDYLDRALAGEPRAPAGLRLEKVRAWSALGAVAKAVAELEVLEGAPDLTQQQRGLVLLWQGDIALSRSSQHAGKALLQFEQALRLGLPDAEAAFARGLLAPTSPEAVKHLEEALRIDPFHQRASALLGLLLVSLGRLPEAHDRIVFAERLFPDDPTFKLLHASVLALEDKLVAARALLQQAAGRWSKQDHANALSWVETLHLAHQLVSLMGEPEASPWKMLPVIGRLALKVPEGMGHKAGPNSTMLFLPLPQSVVKSYGQVTSLTPALWLYGNKTPDKFKDFAEALRVHPEGVLYVLYGQILVRNDRWAEAETAFVTAARTPSVVPVRRPALFWACLCEWTLARQVNAKEASVLKARALQNTRTLAGLGRIHPSEGYYLARIALDMKDLDLARAIIADWQRQAPKDINCLAHRAELELLSGAFGKVIEVSDQILALDAKHKLASSFRKQALERMRRQGLEMKSK